MLRNLSLILLALVTMFAVMIGVALWEHVGSMLASFQPGSPRRYNVAVVEDPLDWVGLLEAGIAAISIVAGFFGAKYWEIRERRQRKIEEERAAAQDRLSSLINARLVAQLSARQIRFAALVALGRPVPRYLGTAFGFRDRWHAWIRYRVEELIAELRSLDSELIGEAELSVARTTLIARLRWLRRTGGPAIVVREGLVDLDHFRRAWEDTADALAAFVAAEEAARLIVALLGGATERGPPIEDGDLGRPRSDDLDQSDAR